MIPVPSPSAITPMTISFVFMKATHRRGYTAGKGPESSGQFLLRSSTSLRVGRGRGERRGGGGGEGRKERGRLELRAGLERGRRARHIGVARRAAPSFAFVGGSRAAAL